MLSYDDNPKIHAMPRTAFVFRHYSMILCFFQERAREKRTAVNQIDHHGQRLDHCLSVNLMLLANASLPYLELE
jgi:hypothetical protein